MSKPDTTQVQASFPAVLRRALEHVHDLAWLSAHSPLATPYFLGAHAPSADQAGHHAPGSALQTLLYDTVDSLWEGGPPPTRAALISAVEDVRMTLGNAGDEYAYLVLELRYFRRYFGPDEYPVESNDIPIYLAVSRTRFFVHLDEAVARLGEILLRRVQPAMRLEQPLRPQTFVGRGRELREITDALTAGNSVSLTGSPGAGKTALGAVVSYQWLEGRMFWYTFLPGLTDSLGAMLFALAHFTRERGASALWAYLAARGGEFDPAQATGLLRGDLETLGEPPILLVLDEIDLLRNTDGEPRSAAHSQLLFFLEALISITPVLLIGQRAYVDTPIHLSLSSLDEQGVGALLDSAGWPLPENQVRRILEVTNGLPRLVWLVIALLHSGEAFDDLARLSLRGDAVPLFHRLWRRLDEDEMEVLVALSVFRRPAPQDVWTGHQAAITSLTERRLLDPCDAGEISPQSFFRRLVYQELSPEQREHYEMQAGQIRADRGDYAAAVYHFAEANEMETAVALWFQHREFELSRGRAGAAHEVFAGVSGKGLPDSTLSRLKIIQNQLYLLSGDPERVTSNVRSIMWDLEDVVSAEAFSQAARSSYVQGNASIALDYYDQSLSVIGKHITNAMNSHYQRGLIYANQTDISHAQTEALRAEQELLMFKGTIDYTGSQFGRAEELFLRARELSEELHDPDLIAQSNRRLAETYSMVGRTREAEDCLTAAIAHYELAGDKLNTVWLRVTLGNVYLNARMFHEAISPTERALGFLEKLGESQYLAQPLTQLAEAYLETGQLDKAIDYAGRVLTVDMPKFRPYAYYTLGLAHQRLGDPQQASEEFASGMSASRSIGDRFIEAYLLRNIGRLHIEQGQPDAAREPLTTALELFRDMGIDHEIEPTEADLAAANA